MKDFTRKQRLAIADAIFEARGSMAYPKEPTVEMILATDSVMRAISRMMSRKTFYTAANCEEFIDRAIRGKKED
jgi:hypothetical protein